MLPVANSFATNALLMSSAPAGLAQFPVFQGLPFIQGGSAPDIESSYVQGSARLTESGFLAVGETMPESLASEPADSGAITTETSAWTERARGGEHSFTFGTTCLYRGECFATQSR